ncbi:MAG TPA: acyl-CoA dehydrogenase family protein, partial [Acidimicrobiales bacterium]|nr:acyl-CoA dehydrogenase family protein [Acidimicrobiales bacterium]
MGAPPRLVVNRSDGLDAVRSAAEGWVADNVPLAWRQAASQGRAAIRAVRSRADYDAWYPTFADSGLVVATWPVAYGGLDLSLAQARVAEEVLAPYNLGRLNRLGLNNTAPVLFAHGSDRQRLRFLPPLVRNEERWCQLFSEPGAGSDLASLATRAIRDGDQWVLTGQKVWSTWAHVSDWGICLARTDPTRPKREGITYFLVDLRTRGVEIRPLRHLGGDVDFNEVFLDHVHVPDSCRVGAVNDGWRVAASTLAGERQMVSGAGSGGVDRIGGSGARHLVELAQSRRRGQDAVVRQRLARVYSEERIRGWTNERGRATVASNDTLGQARSIGKLHQS